MEGSRQERCWSRSWELHARLQRGGDIGSCLGFWNLKNLTVTHFQQSHYFSKAMPSNPNPFKQSHFLVTNHSDICTCKRQPHSDHHSVFLILLSDMFLIVCRCFSFGRKRQACSFVFKIQTNSRKVCWLKTQRHAMRLLGTTSGNLGLILRKLGYSSSFLSFYKQVIRSVWKDSSKHSRHKGIELRTGGQWVYRR